MQREVFIFENSDKLNTYIENRSIDERSLDLGVGFFAAEQINNSVSMHITPPQLHDHFISEIAAGSLSPISQDTLLFGDPNLLLTKLSKIQLSSLPTCRWMMTGLQYQIIGSKSGTVAIEHTELIGAESLSELVTLFFEKLQQSILKIRARQIFFSFEFYMISQYFDKILKELNIYSFETPLLFKEQLLKEFIYWIIDGLLHPMFVIICQNSSDFYFLLKIIKQIQETSSPHNIIFRL